LKNKLKLKGKIPLSIYIIVGVLIILAGVLSYIITLPDEFARNKDLASSRCVDLCLQKVSASIDLAGEGPCLSEEIATGWVCDVVHDPRVSLIDDQEQNQCQNYDVGKTKHFVEVSPLCKVVRVK